MMSRIEARFNELKSRRDKGLITYITAGDPDPATTKALVLEMAATGADIIELGIPFSDPIADGPIIQKASERSLRGGTTTRKVLDLVAGLRRETEVPIALMTYYNPIYRYGLEAFVKDAEASGVDGLIVPDLSLEESEPLMRLTAGRSINLIVFIAPTSTPKRMMKAAEAAKGFIYCVSLTGVTGTRNELPRGLEEFAQRLRAHTRAPLALGFGISTPAQARRAASCVDAVIVGSAIVRLIEERTGSAYLVRDVGEFVAKLKRALNE